MTKAQIKIRDYLKINDHMSYKKFAYKVDCSPAYVHKLLHMDEPNPSIRLASQIYKVTKTVNFKDWIKDA